MPTPILRSRLPVAGVIVLGVLVRTFHLLIIDPGLPYMAGGLFVEFAHQIIRGSYAFPHQIPFCTEGGIPFAYPPLPFYLEALTIDVLSLSPIQANNLLPPLLAVLTLPAFYVLTGELDLDFRTRLISLIAFAVMPATFAEQIQGAGLAEVSGTLAIIILAAAMARAARLKTPAAYAILAVCWALSVMASPGSALGSVLMMIPFAAAVLGQTPSDQRARTLGLITACGSLALVVSAPFWASVLVGHGSSLFSGSVGGQVDREAAPIAFARQLFAFRLSGTDSFLVWNGLILAGSFYALFNRRVALLVWLLLCLSIPRESIWMAGVPAALLAGVGAAHVAAPSLSAGWQHQRERAPVRARIFAGGMGTYLVLVMLLTPFNHILRDLRENGAHGVTHDHLAAAEWARQNLPPDARLIVLDHYLVHDWLPFLVRRTTINPDFGTEWEPDEARRIAALNHRIEDCHDLTCVGSAAYELGYRYEALYLWADQAAWERLGSEDQNADVEYQRADTWIIRLQPPFDPT